MDQKFIQANIKDKKNYLEQLPSRLQQDEIENIYKHLNSLGTNGFELLKFALEKNAGLILPDKYSYQTYEYKKKFLESIIDSVKELDLMGLYAYYFNKAFPQSNYSRSDTLRLILKHIGFRAEKLIYDFRQQGNICQKLFLNKNDQDPLHMDKKSIVVDMIIILCPKDLSFNPELFQLMMQPFKDFASVEQYNLEKLDKLAEVLLSQCKGQGQADQNSVHDWLTLITGIFLQAFNQKCLGLHILLTKMGMQPLQELIMQHQKYLLFYFFNNSQNTIRIFQGLTEYSIVQENLYIIKTISELILKKLEQTHEDTYFQTLQDVYEQFILPTIMGNIQMADLQEQIMDILLFYMVGFSKIKQKVPDNAIDLMQERLRLLMNLSFQRDFMSPAVKFCNTLIKYYPNLLKNEKFHNLYQYAKDKSRDIYSSRDEYNNYFPFSILPEKLNKNGVIDRELLFKDYQDYVGLENLTNTCFMNSFLQSMFMTTQFRQFILQLPINMSSIQFQDERSMITSLQKLFVQLTYQKQGYCSPYELKRQLREPYSNTNDQQDVGEFAHHFLDDLTQCLKPELRSEFQSMFFGKQRSVLECANCPKQNNKSVREGESFLGLDLHFHKSKSQILGSDCNLIEMIQSQFEKEFIDFKCEKCKQKSESNSKWLEIMTLPSQLMMTIHRFTYDPINQQMTKILNKVPFQFDIDMRDVFQNNRLDPKNSKYKLYAFIVHLGKNSYSGHYICYARQLSQQTDKWIAFDDTYISSQERASQDFDEQLIAEETPYILFYQNESQQELVIQK